MRFTNTVAVITGAGRGIGAAIAQRLASEGAKVAVVSRTEANSQKVADAINAQFPEAARAYAVDVADHAASAAAAQQIAKDFGQVDVLVNNAGVTRDRLALRLSEEDWDVVLDTNLKGAFNFIQPLLRPIMKSGKGRIINISSVSGLMGTAGQVNYGASKAGLIGLSKSLAREVASRGVTVNVIAPGFITTDMTDVLTDDLKKMVQTQIPLASFGEPDDIASAVAFLASAEARYITGQVLTVDGGLSM
ncbi:MAG: 3-oxoacyl-[acyl-carrier-protein] reductase [Chthoniobacterales bacterium]